MSTRQSTKSYLAAKEQLIRVPLPEQTKTYKPVSNSQLIDLTLEGILQSGYELDKESYSLGKEGRVATGRYTIKNVEDPEIQLMIAWENSYDKSRQLQFSVGALVKVCTNGMMAFRNVGAFKKKHVGEIQTFAPNMIPEYIKGSGDMFHSLQKDRDALKQIEVSKRTTAEILGRMYIEQKIIEATQLNMVKREVEHPSIIYSPQGSMWELYNFVTFSMRELHPSLWMQAHLDVHDFFMNEAGIMVPEQKPIVTGTAGEYDPRQLNLFDELFQNPVSAESQPLLQVYNGHEVE